MSQVIKKQNNKRSLHLWTPVWPWLLFIRNSFRKHTFIVIVGACCSQSLHVLRTCCGVNTMFTVSGCSNYPAQLHSWNFSCCFCCCCCCQQLLFKAFPVLQTKAKETKAKQISCVWLQEVTAAPAVRGRPHQQRCMLGYVWDSSVSLSKMPSSPARLCHCWSPVCSYAVSSYVRTHAGVLTHSSVQWNNTATLL